MPSGFGGMAFFTLSAYDIHELICNCHREKVVAAGIEKFTLVFTLVLPEISSLFNYRYLDDGIRAAHVERISVSIGFYDNAACELTKGW